jgi:RNA polymerase sigma factor (sigma-70 family)
VPRSPRLLSDERLATLAGTGSDPAFAMLYRRFDGPLHGYCMSIVRDAEDARDVLQSAWMKALVALRSESRRAPVRPWLFRIVHNEAIDLIRRRRGDEPLVDSDRLGGTAGADEEVVGRENVAEVVADLRELPEGQRAALVMREWADLEYADIALALATSEGNARQLVFTARSGLVESRAGREQSCDAIRLELAGADGRRLRNRRIRSHLDSCDACREFSAESRGRRRAAAAALVPWGAGAPELLGGILSAGGTAGGVTGGSALLGGLAKGMAVAALVSGGVGTAEMAIETGRGGGASDRAGVVEVAGGAPAARGAVMVSRTPVAAVRKATVARAAPAAEDVVLAAGPDRADPEAALDGEPGAGAGAGAGGEDEPGGRRREGGDLRESGGPRAGGGRRDGRRRGDGAWGGADGAEREGRRDGGGSGSGGSDSWEGGGSAETGFGDGGSAPDGGSGDGGRRQRASTHTDFLRAPSGSHMGE